MYLSPINYQPQVRIDNRNVNFKSKAMITKSMEETGKRTLRVIAATALAMLFGTKKQKTVPETATVEEPIINKTIEEAKEEKIISDTTIDNKKIKEEKRAERLKNRAEAAKQAEKEKHEAKIAARKEKITKELEKSGISDVQETKNGTIRFIYENVTYELVNISSNDVNLFKSLQNALVENRLNKDLSLKAVSGNKSYDCDWFFDKNIGVTEQILEFLDKNNAQLSNAYFKNNLEKYVENMSSDDLDKLLDEHSSVALSTTKVQEYIETLKETNPSKYIKIVTPEKIYETEEGKLYLKNNMPDKFKKLETKEKEIKLKAKVEKTLDYLLPPASTVDIIERKSKVTKESRYIEGYYDYDTAPTGVKIESTKEWVPGHWTDEEIQKTIVYKYNGTQIRIQGENTTYKELEEKIISEINNNRDKIKFLIENFYRMNPDVESIIEIVDYKDVYNKSVYIEGCYDTPDKGACGETWIPGHWTKPYTRNILTYKIGDKVKSLSATDQSKEYLLKSAHSELVSDMLSGKFYIKKCSNTSNLNKTTNNSYSHVVGRINSDGTVNAPIGTDMSSLDSYNIPAGTRLYYGPGDLRNGTTYSGNSYYRDMD